MRDTELFQMALGLTPPWKVESSEFDPDRKRLDIMNDFPRGETFTCPECAQEGLKAYDNELKYWRHLNFYFQHERILAERVPRVKCSQCGIWGGNIPWVRSGSGFTLIFEAIIMVKAKTMPVKTASFIMNYDIRLRQITDHYIEQGRLKADHSKVKNVGFDEIFSKQGHDYVSLFVDLEGPRILFDTEGKDSSTVERFKQDLIDHYGYTENIQQMCYDMSPAFIKGARE